MSIHVEFFNNVKIFLLNVGSSIEVNTCIRENLRYRYDVGC